MKLSITLVIGFFLFIQGVLAINAHPAAETYRKTFNPKIFQKQETKHLSALRRRAIFAGRWKGTLYQPNGLLRPKFAFTMRFYQKGNNLSGFSRISIPDSPQYFGVMRMKGVARKSRLSFTEVKIIRENVAQNAYWCIKSGNHKLSYSKGKPILKGNWHATDCPSGTIVLKKVSGK